MTTNEQYKTTMDSLETGDPKQEPKSIEQWHRSTKGNMTVKQGDWWFTVCENQKRPGVYYWVYFENGRRIYSKKSFNSENAARESADEARENLAGSCLEQGAVC